MITETIKFVGRLFAPANRGPLRIARDKHGIDRRNVSRHAIKVCEVLRQHGYDAYIVGGAVRDLIVGLEPGLRRGHQRHARADPPAVPPRPHHRPPLPAGARVRPGDHRDLHLPRARLGRPGNRRARPHPARQRVRLAGRGRGAPRLHHERALLRSAHRGSHRLPPRRVRPEEAPDPHDRRPGQTLPRRPGAHAARGALRRQAQRHHRPGHAPAHRHHGGPDRERAGLAPVRRNAQAADLQAMPWTACASCAPTACTRVCCRCWTWCWNSPAANTSWNLHWNAPTPACAPARPSAPASCSPRCWQQVEVRWKQLRAQGEHTIPAPSQAADSVLDEQTEKLAIQRRFVGHARDLVHAAALRAPHGQDHLPHDRAAALPRRLRFLQPRAAGGEFDSVLAQWWMDLANADDDLRGEMIEEASRLPRDPADAPASTSANRRRRRRRARAARRRSKQ